MLRIELRCSIGLLAVPLLALVTWVLVINGMMTPEVRLWPETSQLTISTAFVLAPAAGALSAWVATRDRRRGMEEMLSVSACPPFVRELVTWAGTMLWPLLTCLGITGFYFFLTFREATWGRPLLAPLLLGLLYVVSYSAVGHAAGRWVPSRFTAPLVAVGLFFGAWGLIILPTQEIEPMLGPDPNAIAYVNVFEEPLGLWGWRILWPLGLTGAALSAVALKSRRSPLRWVAFAVCAVAAFGSAATIVGAMGNESLAKKFGVYENEQIPYELVCEEGRITICVHPAYEKLLPKTAKTINKVAEPLKGIPNVPNRMVQAENTTYEEGRNAKNTAYFDLDVWLWEYENLAEGNAVYALVTDEESEIYGPPPGDEPDARDLEICGEVRERYFYDLGAEAGAVVEGWLLKEADSYTEGPNYYQCSNTEELIEDFSTLDPSERRAWLRENFDDLRAGKVALRDLP